MKRQSKQSYPTKDSSIEAEINLEEIDLDIKTSQPKTDQEGQETIMSQKLSVIRSQLFSRNVKNKVKEYF